MSSHAIMRRVDTDTLVSRMRCEGRELEACRRRGRKILSLLERSRRDGIIAAADERNNAEYPFMLRLALRLMGNGTDPDDVMDILSTYIFAGDHSGASLLTRVLILEGTDAMQNRKAPADLAREWTAYLGPEYAFDPNSASNDPSGAPDADADKSQDSALSILAEENDGPGDLGSMDFRI